MNECVNIMFQFLSEYDEKSMLFLLNLVNIVGTFLRTCIRLIWDTYSFSSDKKYYKFS